MGLNFKPDLSAMIKILEAVPGTIPHKDLVVNGYESPTSTMKCTKMHSLTLAYRSVNADQSVDQIEK